MTLASPRTKSTGGVPARRGRPPKAKSIDFQEPLPTTEPERPASSAPSLDPEVKQAIDPERPQDHKGIPVMREELMANIPGAHFKVSKLHLANGEIAHACRDCLFTADTRGEVSSHRNAEHGARYGKGRKPLTLPIERAPDLVLSPREDGSPSPDNPLDWTMRELLALMPSIAAFADLTDRMERERDAAVAELLELRKDRHKVDVYDALHDEVVDLRLRIRNTGSYEELTTEVRELRTFKKKIIARLSALGFAFNEEE